MDEGEIEEGRECKRFQEIYIVNQRLANLLDDR